MRQNRISIVSKFIICALLIAGAAAVHAADATGKWTWSTPGRNGGPDRTNTLTLKVDGTALTGKLTTPGRNGSTTDTEIKDGKVDGDSISFNTVRERNGNSMTNKYSGKVESDKITGKMEYTNRDGDPQSRDWSATKSTDTK